MNKTTTECGDQFPRGIQLIDGYGGFDAFSRRAL